MNTAAKHFDYSAASENRRAAGRTDTQAIRIFGPHQTRVWELMFGVSADLALVTLEEDSHDEVRQLLVRARTRILTHSEFLLLCYRAVVLFEWQFDYEKGSLWGDPAGPPPWLDKSLSRLPINGDDLDVDPVIEDVDDCGYVDLAC